MSHFRDRRKDGYRFRSPPTRDEIILRWVLVALIVSGVMRAMAA